MIILPYNDKSSLYDSCLFEKSCRRESTVKLRVKAIEQAIYTMHECFHESLTLQDMASAAYLSPYHFNRVFHSITGTTPIVFLSAIRMKNAKRLLLTTNRSITSICFDVGYRSLGTFTTRFTQCVGVNPTQFRAMAQEGIESLQMHDMRDDINYILGQQQSSPSKVSVTGHIYTSVPFSGLIFVGVFTSPLPQGPPISCTLLVSQGAYRLLAIPEGKYYLFAAALRWTDDFITALITGVALRGSFGEQPLRIKQGHVVECKPITLHPDYWTDPPLLVALPWLIKQKCAQLGATSHTQQYVPSVCSLIQPEGNAS